MADRNTAAPAQPPLQKLTVQNAMRLLPHQAVYHRYSSSQHGSTLVSTQECMVSPRANDS
eukprot:350841-Chlamydomonas_euryale.AAC.8